MAAQLVDEHRAPSSTRPGGAPPPRRTRLAALPEVRWAALAALAFVLAFPLDLAGAPAWVWGPLYALSYAAGGWEPGWAGLQALRDKTLDVDLLMVVAALGAAGIGQFLDGGLLIVIFAVSGALEALATRRTADSVRGLLDLAPATALRLADDGAEQRVNVTELQVHDTVLVRPGERLPADGTVISGASDVDQATITGEPLPVAKQPGDTVFAGTLNGTGALRLRVDRDASDSVIARIVAMVEEASETKAPTQLFIEKVEQRYSVGVVVATLALFAIPLAFGAEFTATLLRAMTFMIVASPCAVVLATMPPLLSAIANAGRHGVLVKSAVVMERLGEVTQVALDKTGTLTEGAPRVAAVRVLVAPGRHGTAGATDATDQDGEAAADAALALAAAAEHPSEHPLARAVVSAALERGLALESAHDFDSAPGSGVRAVIGGREVRVGSPAAVLGGASGTAPQAAAPVWGRPPNMPHPASDVTQTTAEAPHHVAGLPPGVAEAWKVVADEERTGRTAVVLTVDGSPTAVLAIEDRTRAGAADAVTALRQLTGAEPALLTGDNERAARRLADETGITDVRAGLLPQDKVAAVRGWEEAGQKVLVVGDGVNDAPALAAAHSGLAMGRAGADLALETADAVVVRDELRTVPAVVALSRQARRVVRQNLVIASVCIGALVVWDLVGHLPLPLGVAGHEGSTVLVGLNGLRLLRGAAWRRLAA
ncbi:heavy metal translocating P-type ATPase [Streptomyces zagrosensis]|uniref:Heavy metal translocating P-type ATPase n=1 Tax=Streptomyces zagrosensis TaxID=1042984 RepID=A0A7W9QD15_9ACTN|nr:heavy metal translocating P-type ATPase [Streptomyces zagrosensis]MBB5937866.1 heavy metal translocating P-type ATPase [Streptomyces zagrosensis]